MSSINERSLLQDIANGQAILEWLPEFPNRYYQLVKLNSMSMEPNSIQAQGLYKLCYQLTNAIYPGWQYKAVELVRVDERTGSLYVLAGNSLDFEIKPTGGDES